MLTKQMAVDYSRENIRINCICPGYVDTDLGGRRTRMEPEDADGAPAARDAKAAMQPIPRQAQPEEMAGIGSCFRDAVVDDDPRYDWETGRG